MNEYDKPKLTEEQQREYVNRAGTGDLSLVALDRRLRTLEVGYLRHTAALERLKEILELLLGAPPSGNERPGGELTERIRARQRGGPHVEFARELLGQWVVPPESPEPKKDKP